MSPAIAALNFASVVVPLIAGGLWVMSARVQVRNSLDDFIDDLHLQGRWNAAAAIARAVAAALQAATHLV